MNREQRRRLQKEEKRRPNSKKNFVDVGEYEIPIDQIQHDPNLKECDMEVVELISKRYDWAEKGLVKNDFSKCIIIKACDYLDSLCSLRFDITPPDDKALIRDTMYYICNFTNLFMGLLINEDSEDVTLSERTQKHFENGDKDMNAPVVHKLYPMCSLPDKDLVDDMYASFVAEHAHELSPFLQHTRKSDIEGDEEYVLEALDMILKKTDELVTEAQVNSQKFIVNLQK